MDYIELSAQKTLFIVFVVSVLIVAVLSTFAYKSEHYGSVSLPVVLTTAVEKSTAEMYYRARFSSGSLGNALLAAFSGEGRESYSRKRAEAVPALIYHGIAEESSHHSISEEQFADHMQTLHEAGWRTVTLKEFEGFLRGGQELPERSFLLTFDDGAKSSYYPVDPILAALDMTAATYVLPKYSVFGGSHYYLSLGELKTMIASGRWEVGSHGQDGHDMVPIDAEGSRGAALANKIWLEDANALESTEAFAQRIAADLKISRLNLERALGISVASFAFPFGEFGQVPVNYPESEEVLKSAAEEVYNISFYQARGGEGFPYNYPDRELENPSQMVFAKRIEPTPDMDGADLLKRLEDGLPKSMPFTDDFGLERGWMSAWGPFEYSRSGLELRSLPTETGSAVVLNGSGAWRDHTFRAVVNSPRGTGVYLWVRYKDNKSHAGCNFGNGFIHVEETIEHATSVIKGVRGPEIAIPEGDFTIEARVHGRTLTCILNGTTSVTSEFLDRSLERGGIGIKVWEPVMGSARVTVKQVEVQPIGE